MYVNALTTLIDLVVRDNEAVWSGPDIFNAGGSFTCSTSCSVGQYGDCNETARTSDTSYECYVNCGGCRTCPAGTSNPGAGSMSGSSCVACPIGQASPRAGAASCTRCEAGHYATDTSGDYIILRGATNCSTVSSGISRANFQVLQRAHQPTSTTILKTPPTPPTPHHTHTRARVHTHTHKRTHTHTYTCARTRTHCSAQLASIRKRPVRSIASRAMQERVPTEWLGQPLVRRVQQGPSHRLSHRPAPCVLLESISPQATLMRASHALLVSSKRHRASQRVRTAHPAERRLTRGRTSAMSARYLFI